MGHLPLCLRPAPPPGLPGTVSGEPKTGLATPSLHPRFLGLCESRSTAGRNPRRLQREYSLNFIENPELPLDWRVEKMKLSKDKTQIVYNDFLTLAGIPAKALDYRLGNRSALEWVIDQYRVKTDKRSGIINDPNRGDDPQYIVKLIGKVITVSLETVEIVEGLPELGSTTDE